MTPLEVKGHLPAPRYGHTCVYNRCVCVCVCGYTSHLCVALGLTYCSVVHLDDQLWLFGGYTSESSPSAELWAINVGNTVSAWHNLPTPTECVISIDIFDRSH